MARGGKWACKETTTYDNGNMWSRWFASSYDMSSSIGDKTIQCSRYSDASHSLSHK